MTQIVVFRNAVAAEEGNDTAALAARCFDQQERVMREQGVARGMHALHDIARGSRTVGDRPVETFSCRKDVSPMRFGRKVELAMLCVGFPPDFGETRQFYGFLVSWMRQKGALVEKPELGQIDQVIESFRPAPE